MEKEDYYKAVLARDARFDGVFFICVKSTGIYCRPICPTHPPKIENCSFVTVAAEAEQLGYRPCLRCRPELAPFVRLAHESLAQSLSQHIEETLLIDETLGDVAAKYNMSDRHLRRLFTEAFGVEPKQYVTTRRLLFAKQLLQETNLAIADVAYSAGFNTPARLTVNMRQAYGFTPERLRKEKHAKQTDYLTLRADYRPPFDWNGLLLLLKGRSTPLEYVDAETYSRTVDGKTITVRNDAQKNRLSIQIPIELSRQAHTIVRTVRRLFDLDANPSVIENALSEDPVMAQLVQQFPGTRVPGAWDNFELLLRVIIGQQISVAGATTVMRRLAEQIGTTPNSILQSSPSSIAAVGIPVKRAETIYLVGKMVQNGQLNLEERNPQAFYDQFVAVSGIGKWTAEYLQLRVLHWPDVLLAGDLGVQKALAVEDKRPSEKQVTVQALAWRPWRSYATMLLWKSIANQGG